MVAKQVHAAYTQEFRLEAVRSRVAWLTPQRVASCFWLRYEMSILASFRMGWQASMKARKHLEAKA